MPQVHTNKKVGAFRVHAIDDAGNVTVGCHRVRWRTMHALAGRLGVALADPTGG